MILNILCVYLLIMAFMAIYWTAHSVSLNNAVFTKYCMFLCFTICIYMLGYAMEITSTTESQILFWNKFQYFGIPFVSSTWLFVSLLYTGHFYKRKKVVYVLVFLIPVVTFILRFTNELHHLYFTKFEFISEQDRLLLKKTPGPGYYIQSLHSALLIIFAFIIFVSGFVKQKKDKHGKQRLMVVASLIGILGLSCNIIRPFGLSIDYMVIFLPISSILINIAILKYDFMEIKTLARNSVFQSSSDSIMILNHNELMIDINPSGKKLIENLGVRTNPIGKDIEHVFTDHKEFLEKLTAHTHQIISVNIDKEMQYYEINTDKILDKQGEVFGWVKTIRNITKVQRLNESLKKQAMMDELSQLHNRRAFMEKGYQILSRASQSITDQNNIAREDVGTYLLMLDLDNFKKVNDKYGHHMGDQVIQHFGQLLREVFAYNSVTARLGGEEFGVLIQNMENKLLDEKIVYLLNTFENHIFNGDNIQFSVTVSIGKTKWRNIGQSLDQLLVQADKALYQSKLRGRNCYTTYAKED